MCISAIKMVKYEDDTTSLETKKNILSQWNNNYDFHDATVCPIITLNFIDFENTQF